MSDELVRLLERLIHGATGASAEGLVVAGASLDALVPLAAAGDVSVRWLGQNEGRVDAGVVAPGREWRVVFFLGDDGLVTSVDVHEKPPLFEGVPGGRAIVVNGPSGAGKSSLMEAVLEQATTPWVIFDEPWLGATRQVHLIWRDTAPVLHEGFLRGIAAVAATGNQVALAAAGHPAAVVTEAFAGVPLLLVGLDCPLEVLLVRERGRPGRWGGLAAASLDVHDGWSYDLRFDSSTTGPQEMAEAVLDAVADRRPGEDAAAP